MEFRLSLTNMPYHDLSEEQKEVLKVYDSITYRGYKSYYTCNKDLSSIFTVKTTNEGLYFLNENIRKVLLDKFLFGFKFFTSYYTRDGIKKGQIGFESKNYGIFRSTSDIQKFRKGLFVGYVKDKNLVYCHWYIAECLNNLFKHYKKDVVLSDARDENAMKIFDYDLNWYSLGEVQELYKKIRNESNDLCFRLFSGDELVKLLEENGYSIVRIKASSSKFIPLEERKNYPIVETKGTKRYFIKKN
jgi:hypothetical protein